MDDKCVSSGGGKTAETRKSKLGESVRRNLQQYGTIDKEQAKRLDEQWSGVVGEPCCPIHPKPNTPGWFAMNHFDNQGNACVGGCGDQKEPMGIDHMEEEHRRDHEGHRVKKKKL